MRIGDLHKQLAFDDITKDGAHYSLESNNKDVKLEEIFVAAKDFLKSMPRAEKVMLRDLCLMISNGNIPDPTSEEGGTQVIRFITGFLLGRYFAKTNTQMYAEEVKVSNGEN